MTALPFLTSYDPPGSGEGTLDPLGLSQIAEQLALHLVPAVRERMLRIRFLTTIALGSLVTEELDPNPEEPTAPPWMVWEWLVVESLVRNMGGAPELWGVPGTLVTGRALQDYGYLDQRSYLKTPRIFGFHGVYKRLAVHLQLVDTDLAARSEAEGLVDSWARDQNLGGLSGAQEYLRHWREAVKRSLDERPVRTRPKWRKTDWASLADAMVPKQIGRREKRRLRRLLHTSDERALGALPAIWSLQPEFDDENFSEEALHAALEREAPENATLLQAIWAYERFARQMQDAFDLIRAKAGEADTQGLAPNTMADDNEFANTANTLADSFGNASRELSEADSELASRFEARFSRFAESMDPTNVVYAICEHHEEVQNDKSVDGKRPWLDRIGGDRLYLRQRYRIERPTLQPERYLHNYRSWPVRRFYLDLQ
jgi:hypothetical protein